MIVRVSPGKHQLVQVWIPSLDELIILVIGFSYLSSYRNDTSQYRKAYFVNCFGVLAYFLGLLISFATSSTNS